MLDYSITTRVTHLRIFRPQKIIKVIVGPSTEKFIARYSRTCLPRPVALPRDGKIHTYMYDKTNSKNPIITYLKLLCLKIIIVY